MSRWGALALLGLGACLGTTPEEAAEEALGDFEHETEQADGRRGVGPRHRPGQPCLVCHSEEHNPGGDIFVLAGTVYEDAMSLEGLGGVTVRFTDAEGYSYDAETNPAGTFFVKVDSNLADWVQPENGDGELRIPGPPVFPLEVELFMGDRSAAMRSRIQREGSCAGCHSRAGESEDSPGQVVLDEELAP